MMGRWTMCALALSMTIGCGKKGEECKAMRETFNAGVEKMNEAKKDLKDDDKRIGALEAHIEAAESLGKDLKEPTTEGLKGAYEEAKNAASAVKDAAEKAKAMFEQLDKVSADLDKPNKVGEKMDIIKNGCREPKETDDEQACKDWLEALGAFTKASDADKPGAIDEMGKVAFADADLKKALAETVAEMKRPLELLEQAKKGKKSAGEAKAAFDEAGDKMDDAAKSITDACK